MNVPFSKVKFEPRSDELGLAEASQIGQTAIRMPSVNLQITRNPLRVNTLLPNNFYHRAKPVECEKTCGKTAYGCSTPVWVFPSESGLAEIGSLPSEATGHRVRLLGIGIFLRESGFRGDPGGDAAMRTHLGGRRFWFQSLCGAQATTCTTVVVPEIYMADAKVDDGCLPWTESWHSAHNVIRFSSPSSPL